MRPVCPTRDQAGRLRNKAAYCNLLSGWKEVVKNALCTAQSAQSTYMELTDSPCAMRRMVSASI